MKDHSKGIELSEVICGFWFDTSLNEWDSTYFGAYHEKIKSLGYTEKQEQKGLRINFNINPNLNEPAKAEPEVTENRMVFINRQEGTAAILASNYISIHKLKPYSGWDNFYPQTVEKLLELYFELGLGKGIQAVNVTYINQIEINSGEHLSDFLNVLPKSTVLSKGKQLNCLFQTQYQFDDSMIAQISLIQQVNSTEKNNYRFECSCISTTTEQIKSLKTLASRSHDKANEIFKSIIN